MLSCWQKTPADQYLDKTYNTDSPQMLRVNEYRKNVHTIDPKLPEQVLLGQTKQKRHNMKLAIIEKLHLIIYDISGYSKGTRER